LHILPRPGFAIRPNLRYLAVGFHMPLLLVQGGSRDCEFGQQPYLGKGQSIASVHAFERSESHSCEVARTYGLMSDVKKKLLFRINSPLVEKALVA
jgi:hypothetical protein